MADGATSTSPALPGEAALPNGSAVQSTASAPRLLAVAAVHAALVIGSWLFAALVYAVVVARSHQLGWIAIDAALIAGCGAAVHRGHAALGFRSLGRRRGAKLVAIFVLGTACALVVQLVIHDRNGVWLDERNYLATVRAGWIVRDGVLPFNLRWLEPVLASSGNLLPVDDADALKALNFGGFAVTAALLVLLLVRLRIALGLALAAPVFLLCSYLGVYGAHNRLVIDAFNYALYAVLFHLVVRRDHAGLFAAALVIAACNSEKAIYWVPVFAVVELLRRAPGPPGARSGWLGLDGGGAVRRVLMCTAPAVVYLIAIRLYLAPATTAWDATCFENLGVMALSDLGAQITNPAVQGNTFQRLWLPFGAFTLYALLGFARAPRWMKPVALLLLPIMLQALLVCDSERMVAYSFIVYIPFGYLYLSQALRALPRGLARAWFALAIAVPIAERYGLVIARRLRHAELAAELSAASDVVALALAATELVLVAALVFVHLTFFAHPQRED